MAEFTIRFNTVRPANMTIEYANRRYALVYGRVNLSDIGGRYMTVQTSPGSFIIRNENTYMLADETSRKPVGAGLTGGEYNKIYAHSI
jgi:hypothetical protein